MLFQDVKLQSGILNNKLHKEILTDYKIAFVSRNLSILGRKEVLTGKAKFGIFGDGKELAQIAFAKNFKNGDWRAGYYRDQTFMLASGLMTPENFFASLYGNTSILLNSDSGGRSFNNHFATRSLDKNGKWKNLTKQKNSSSDISPTAGQMPRLLGLAYASKIFRNGLNHDELSSFTLHGNEVAFGTIGEASTSEGHFFEVMNAAGVLQVPLAISVWDDNYGISVHKKHQTIKESISKILSGFNKEKGTNGINIYYAKGWDYPELCKIFNEGIEICRNEHIPVLFHIDELTQPTGHSTSGSHERYKSKERLKWEAEYDCNKKMKEWILRAQIASLNEIERIEKEAIDEVKKARDKAWKDYIVPLQKNRQEVLSIIEKRSCVCKKDKIDKISIYSQNLRSIQNPQRKDSVSIAKKILHNICSNCPERRFLTSQLKSWLNKSFIINYEKYSAHLYNESYSSALNISPVPPKYNNKSVEVAGYEILRDNFDKLLQNNGRLIIFGEDVGKLGGVNKTYEGLQEKYGQYRVTDTGIRETSIIGQGIGMALRGLRPIAEIQYFDYLLYALQTISDDLATTHWRTVAGQVVPLIISTRGHRFEGVWHAGSPLSMIINSIRGVYICVPRNMVQAAGFYNTLLEGEDPAIVIEPLIGYRLKELRPENIGKYKIPLGVPEILVEGNDITIVTYGSCVGIAQNAVQQLKDFNISVELIDVQTLLPFDIHNIIVESIKKTNRVLFFDEDVPGGASAFMLQKVIEEQKAYKYLDSSPQTLSAREHRPAYSTDGDYFSNPNADNVFEKVYSIMHESNPQKYPEI